MSARVLHNQASIDLLCQSEHNFDKARKISQKESRKNWGEKTKKKIRNQRYPLKEWGDFKDSTEIMIRENKNP